MSARFAVITGASTGIGEACALHLDGLGFEVFAGVRRQSDGEALKAKASTRLRPLLLDVTDSASVAAAAGAVSRITGEAGLAGLVNNAGIAVGGPLEVMPLDRLRRQFEVNVIGLVGVTQAFLPLIRTARGRVVNMGSISGRLAMPLVGAYSASKFALEALTETLSLELHPWGIHVCLVGPGRIATPIWRKSIDETSQSLSDLPAEAQALYAPLMSGMQAYQERLVSTGLPAAEVARAVEHALTAERPRLRYAVGKDAKRIELLRLLPPELRRRLILKRMARLMDLSK